MRKVERRRRAFPRIFLGSIAQRTSEEENAPHDIACSLFFLAKKKQVLLAYHAILQAQVTPSFAGRWALFMSEPVIYSAIGFLLATLFFFGARLLLPRLRRFSARRLEEPRLIADIEAEMGELHGQIAIATRRLEDGVAQMKARTTSQLSEIGKTSAMIARLKAELGERTVAVEALAAKERSLYEQLRITEAELSVKGGALAETERKLAQD